MAKGSVRLQNVYFVELVLVISGVVILMFVLGRLNPVFGGELQVVQAPSTPTSMPIPTNTPTPIPTNTPTPTATLIPCPPEGTPVVIEDIKIFFNEAGVTEKECSLILEYAEKTNEWVKASGYTTGPVELHVFTSARTAAEFEYVWGRKMGCNPDSKDIILSSWEYSGGQSFFGAAFLLTTGWWDEHPREVAGTVAHEIIHVVQGNYIGSCQGLWKVPDWVKEGQAQFIGRLLQSQSGGILVDTSQDLRQCKKSLRELEAGEYCIYLQGEQAFILLTYLYGEKGFFLFELMGKGTSFTRAFEKVYGISVTEFYTQYENFQMSGYKLPSPTPTTTHTVNE